MPGSIELAEAVNVRVVVKLIPTRSGATAIPVNGKATVLSMAVCTLDSSDADPSEAIP
jgi:hypothetical protein